MAEMLCRTKGNSDPKGKPRVYFTCHPEDFELYFDRICKDIFAAQDCAIYYTEDMEEEIARQDRETDLGCHNLFVVPVTFRLLTQPNRAMDTDLPYAMEKKIPILPFMMEQNIREFYVKKFGKLHYFSTFTQDNTEISYEKKLKKYLNSVLVSNALARRIRAEFHTYIFLSYRKKDRRYVNELMKLIHSYPEFRDVAIWYDEFLTPGESFTENIGKMLKKSALFTLLVTPHILEMPDGKPNFVMGVEYPAACKAGKKILPVQMKRTSRKNLEKKFAGLPQCIQPQDEKFTDSLLAAVSKAGKKTGPLHDYLIGLAYMEGIDVEIDRKMGMKLIHCAGESGLPEAMEKLYSIYDAQGKYRQAAKWCARVIKYYTSLYSGMHPVTLQWLERGARNQRLLGDYAGALKQQEKVYRLRCKVLGEKHRDTLRALNNLASIYEELGNMEKALEVSQKVCELCEKLLGKKHPDTLRCQAQLGKIYLAICEQKKNYVRSTTSPIEYVIAEDILSKTYALQCKVLGEEHPDTLTTMDTLAILYTHHCNPEKSLEMCEKAYEIRCRISGEEHPDTLGVLHNMAIYHNNFGSLEEALKLSSKVYILTCKVLGEKHPDTIVSLFNLAVVYRDLSDGQKALELFRAAYLLGREVFGEAHTKTAFMRNQLIEETASLGDSQQSLKLYEELCAYLCQEYGEEYPLVLTYMERQAAIYIEQEEYDKALTLQEKVYAIQCSALGEAHPDSMEKLENLARTYQRCNDSEKALKSYQQLYALQCSTGSGYGENTLEIIAGMYCSRGEYEKALPLYRKLYDSGMKNAFFTETLASVYEALGDYTKALELYENVYTQFRDAHGPENFLCISPLEKMAEMYDRLGERQKALELAQKAKDVDRKSSAKRELDRLEEEERTCYNNPDRSVELSEQIYALRRETWGEEDPDTITALDKLAWCCLCYEKYEKAQKLYQQLYKIRCKVSGPLHRDAFAALEGLGVACQKQNQWEMALKVFRQLYNQCSEVLGQEHDDTLHALKNLSWTFYNLDDHTNALKYFEKLHTLRAKTGQKERIDDFLITAIIAEKLGAYEKALHWYEAAYSYFPDLYTEKSGNNFDALDAMAKLYARLGNAQKADEARNALYTLQRENSAEREIEKLRKEEWLYSDKDQKTVLLERIYNICREVWGREHSKTVYALEQLALHHRCYENHPMAAKWYAELYIVQCKRFGASSSQTKEVKKHLQTTWKAQNLCKHCGSPFTVEKVCSKCGRPKDY